MKALLINPGGIGDQILLLPLVKVLRDSYPSLEIDLLTEPRSSVIGQLTNLYRKIKTYDFKAKSPNILKLREVMRSSYYKYLISTGASLKANLTTTLSNAEVKIGFNCGILSKLCLTHSIKINTNQYASQMFIDLLNPLIHNLQRVKQNIHIVPDIKLTKENIEWAKEVLAPRIRDRYYAKKIFIHPGVSKLSIKKNILKGWSSKHWATLIEKLIEDPNNTVILIGGKDDHETITEINKRLSFFAKPKNFFDLSSMDVGIEKLAALISSSDLLVCVDSAPMHIAVALGKKLVAFFGPTNPNKLLPKDPRFLPVYAEDLACRPCLFDTRKESCSSPVCLEVTPKSMLNAISKQLGTTAHVS